MDKDKEVKTEEIIIPERISTYEDKRTRVRSVAFPLDFPDGSHGTVILCRIKKEPWRPIDHIKSLTINFQ